jgi:hypothetical protein
MRRCLFERAQIGQVLIETGFEIESRAVLELVTRERKRRQSSVE